MYPKKRSFSLLLSLTSLLFNQILAAPCTRLNDLAFGYLLEAEGFHEQVYVQNGTTKVGYGHVCLEPDCSDLPPSYLPLPLTPTTATTLLKTDLYEIYTCINTALTNPPPLDQAVLNDWEHSGLAFWGYSVGCEEILKSDMMKRLASGESPSWVFYQESPKYPAQTNRRTIESLMLHSGSNIQSFPECGLVD